MESIRELRQMLQAEKVALRKGYWGYKTFSRGPSIYITYPLLKTGIRPNHMTVLTLLTGIAGAIVIGWPSSTVKLIGLGLLYLNLVFDEVDGELARYKKIFSLKGIYLDAINHLAVPALFLISLTISVAQVTALNPIVVLLAGTIGALSWSLLKASGKLSSQVFANQYLSKPELFSLPETAITTESFAAPRGFIKSIAAIRYQVREFFIAIILFAVSLIIEQIVLPADSHYPLTSWLIIGYGTFLTLHVIEEIFKGFGRVEKEVAHLKKQRLH